MKKILLFTSCLTGFYAAAAPMDVAGPADDRPDYPIADKIPAIIDRLAIAASSAIATAKRPPKTIEQSFRDLQEGIGEIERRLEILTPESKVVAFLGQSGAGKSTLINLLTNNVQVISHGRKFQRIKIDEKSPEISDEFKSHTAYPQLVPYDGPIAGSICGFEQEFYCDLPGFDDNRSPEQRILNAISLKKVLLRDNLKICLVLTDKFGADRRESLSAPLQKIMSILPDDYMAITPNISLVITHTTRDFTGGSSLRADLEKLSGEGGNRQQWQVFLSDILQHGRLGSFRRQKEYQRSEIENFIKLVSDREITKDEMPARVVTFMQGLPGMHQRVITEDRNTIYGMIGAANFTAISKVSISLSDSDDHRLVARLFTHYTIKAIKDYRIDIRKSLQDLQQMPVWKRWWKKMAKRGEALGQGSPIKALTTVGEHTESVSELKKALSGIRQSLALNIDPTVGLLIPEKEITECLEAFYRNIARLEAKGLLGIDPIGEVSSDLQWALGLEKVDNVLFTVAAVGGGAAGATAGIAAGLASAAAGGVVTVGGMVIPFAMPFIHAAAGLGAATGAATAIAKTDVRRDDDKEDAAKLKTKMKRGDTK